MNQNTDSQNQSEMPDEDFLRLLDAASARNFSKNFDNLSAEDKNKLVEAVRSAHGFHIELPGYKRIYCQNCQQTQNVEKNVCSGCWEQICRECGCTESHACADGCGWAEPGLCDNCEDC